MITREQLEAHANKHKRDDTTADEYLAEMLLGAIMLDFTEDQIDLCDAIRFMREMYEDGQKGVNQMTHDELIDGLLERATHFECKTVERLDDISFYGWSDEE